MRKTIDMANPADLLNTLLRILRYQPRNQDFALFLERDYLLEIIELGDLGSNEEALARLLDCSDDAKCVLVSFCEAFESHSVAQEFVQLLVQGDVEIIDELVIVKNSWRSRICDDFDCCPAAGSLLDSGDEPHRFGDLPSADLADLDFQWEQTTTFEIAHAKFRKAYLAKRDLTLTKTASGRREVFDELISAFDEDVLRPETLGELVGYLSDVRVRDALLNSCFHDDDLRIRVLRHVLNSIIHIPTEQRCVPLTLLAALAWLDGNASLAKLALRTALQIDPDYSLARLLNRSFKLHAPSSVWRDSVEQVSLEDALLGAA